MDSNACSTVSQSALNAAISRAAAHRVGGSPGSNGFMSIDPDAPDHRVSGLHGAFSRDSDRPAYSMDVVSSWS